MTQTFNYSVTFKSGFLAVYAIVLCCLLVSGSVIAQDATNTTVDVPADPTGVSDADYILGSGDMIRVSVYNQPDLSGDFILDGEGRFYMPLIGSVMAEGFTPAKLERELVGLLKPDYLVNPRVFIQVLNYRPYYLLGEVKGTGEFPYMAGMTYLRAIAIAGGFTYRAKQDHVYVIRGDDPDQVEIKLSVEEKVQPGDIIRIAERFF
jgi:polysaccharide export outer membrane protein